MKRLGVLFITCAGAAWGADQAADKVPAELRSCVAIERNTERLACYDRGIAVLKGAEGATAPSVESSFGLVATTPRADASRRDASEEFRSLRAKVTALGASNGDGVLTLDNGQVWRQISGGQLLLKVGDEVEINRAALGSFQMKVPTGRTAKVKRVR